MGRVHHRLLKTRKGVTTSTLIVLELVPQVWIVSCLYDACRLICLSLFLVYLAAKVLELAGNAACDNKKQHIVPRRLELAIRNDEEVIRVTD